MKENNNDNNNSNKSFNKTLINKLAITTIIYVLYNITRIIQLV